MSNPRALDDLIQACTSAFGGNGEAGRDLATVNIAADDAARKWHRIRQAFQDSRNVNWDELHHDGLTILREESRDLFALWAVLAPLPVVRKHGFVGVAVSLEVCNRFLGDFWDRTYPAAPDGLSLRGSILSQLVSRWTTFAKQATVTENDAPALQMITDHLAVFETQLRKLMPVKLVPSTSELRELIQAFRCRFSAAEEDSPAPSNDGPAMTPGEPPMEQRRALADGSVSEFETVYANAARLLGSRPAEALRQMGDLVERQTSRAGKFRGQVYLGELYLRAGHVQLARQLLTYLDEECGTIKLEDWEPRLCAKLWATLHQSLTTEHAGGEGPKDVKDKLDALFARVCRVDAKQAVALKTS